MTGHPSDDPTSIAPTVIVSATRSGSTLLQRVLNASGSITIWGEHFGLLTPVLRSLRIARKNDRALAVGHSFAEQTVDPDQAGLVANPHVNPFDAEGYRLQLRQFIDDTFGRAAPTGRWGFKEVRYRRPELEMLRVLYPDLKVIVLTREPEDQIFSMARAPWRNAYDLSDEAQRSACVERLHDFAAAWTEQYVALQRYCLEHPASTFRLRYDQLNASSFPSGELGSFLDVDLGDEQRSSSVFSARLGSSDGTQEWSSDDKRRLRELIGEIEWPDRHREAREFFLS